MADIKADTAQDLFMSDTSFLDTNLFGSTDDSLDALLNTNQITSNTATNPIPDLSTNNNQISADLTLEQMLDMVNQQTRPDLNLTNQASLNPSTSAEPTMSNVNTSLGLVDSGGMELDLNQLDFGEMGMDSSLEELLKSLGDGTG